MKNKDISPLYIIFEKMLYDDLNFSDDEEFIFLVLRAYIDFIKESKVVIPDKYFDETIDALLEELNIILNKKIYGFNSIKEFKKVAHIGSLKDKKLAKERYLKLKKIA